MTNKDIKEYVTDPKTGKCRWCGRNHNLGGRLVVHGCYWKLKNAEKKEA